MKYVFSKGLFKEALRRSRTLLIALLIAAIAVSSITLISALMSSRHYTVSDGDAIYMPYDSMYDIAGILPFYVFFMGIGLAISNFGFLNRRNQSDFYHAIPYSRYTLYFSTMLAIALEILIVVLVTVGIPALGCLIGKMHFSYAMLPRVITICFVGTLLVSTITTLAMSVTGTAFSNLVLTGLILFMPRFITVLASAAITENTSIIPYAALGIFSNYSYNIPVGFAMALFDIFGLTGDMFANYSGAIYSAVLTVVYMAVAAILFKNRKSETAGQSAPGRVLQCIYRCAVGSVSAILFAIYVFCSGGDDFSAMLVMIGFSIVPFLLFELITTKSFKRMLKAFPSYIFVVIIAAIVGLGTTITANTLYKVEPKKGEVKSIQVMAESDLYYYSNISYSNYCLQKIKLKDEKLISIATEELSHTIDNAKDWPTRDRNSGSNYYQSPESGEDPRSICITFNLKNGGKVMRYVWFTEANYSTFMDILGKDKDYSSTMLPADHEIVAIGCSGLSDSQSRKVWDIYKAELKSSGKKAITDVDSFDYNDQAYMNNADGYITVNGFIDGYNFSERYCFSFDSMPDTTKEYYNLLNAKAKKNKTIDKAIELATIPEDITEYASTYRYVNFSFDLRNVDYAAARGNEMGLGSEYVNYIASSKDYGLLVGIPCMSHFDPYAYNEDPSYKKEMDYMAEGQRLAIRALESAEFVGSIGERTVKVMLEWENEVDGSYSRECTYVLVDLDKKAYDSLLAYDFNRQYNYYDGTFFEKIPTDVELPTSSDIVTKPEETVASEEVATSEEVTKSDKAKSGKK